MEGFAPMWEKIVLRVDSFSEGDKTHFDSVTSLDSRSIPPLKVIFSVLVSILKVHFKQEAHGPLLAHLSEAANADMQMFCNIFPILSCN